jgi:predicted nucleic acid-binding protein
MILADTSVWVQHFRRGMPAFATALAQRQISTHPIVLGELACGNLVKRAQTLADLRRLPHATVGTFEECLSLIESRSLYGRGLGWNDVQLLVGARLSGHLLWSLDARLVMMASKMGMASKTS